MKELKLLLALNDMDDALLIDALAEKPQKVRKFRPSVILIAAVLVSLLAVSVGAAITEAGWFQNFFERESKQKLTPSQAAVVQASTKECGQSVTLDGYTLTLESVIADPNNCYMKLKITAPEGVVLDSEGGYGYWVPREPKELYPIFAPASGAEFSGCGSWQNLDDGNSRDNQVTILWRYMINASSQVNFETEKVWRLTIRNLSDWEIPENTVLVEGDMCFDITFDKLSTVQLDFLQEPIPYTFTLPGFTGEAEGTITCCTLQPMSGKISISGCLDAVGFHEIPVVMKDGTQVEMQAHIFGDGIYSYTLKAPIDLEEVDHILLEDGTKLYPLS